MVGKRKTKARTRIDATIDAGLWKEATSLAAKRGMAADAVLDDAIRLFLQKERERIGREKELDSVPYGFRFVDGKLSQNSGEQGIIQRIIALKERGRTPDQIALRLSDSRIRTRTGKKWDARAVEDAHASFKGQLRKRISALNRAPVDE